MNRAVFAGSFDPFTNGHLELVKRMNNIFDEVVILICKNSKKNKHINSLDMFNAIHKVIQRENLNNVFVDILNEDELLANYCKEKGIKYTVRGLRNHTDFMYENEIMYTNLYIYPELETVYLPSTNRISSSMVRELYEHNLDVDKYVPVEVLELMHNYYHF